MDEFVDAAHCAPEEALEMLRRNRRLLFARSSWNETAADAASHLGRRMLLDEMALGGLRHDLFGLCALGDVSAVRSTLEMGNPCQYGAHGLPLLHFGIVSRKLEMVRLLIDLGVPVNPSRASLPPLHSAVAARFDAAVALLIESGAYLQATDAFGATAGDWARKLCYRLPRLVLDGGV